MSKALIQEKIKLTADHVAQKYGGVIGLNELSAILNKPTDTIKRDIFNGRLSVPSTRMGNNYVTTPYDIAEYIVRNAS